MCRLIPTLLCLLSALVGYDGARILAYFPIASISHQVVFRPVTQELARRGHEVIVVTPDPVFPRGQTPENLTEIDVHDISYKIWREYLKNSHEDDTYPKYFNSLSVVLREIFKQQLLSEEVSNLIRDKNQTFDLLLTEACFRPTLALSHLFNVPVVQISSFGSWIYNYEVIGASVHPIIYPLVISQKLYNLTWMDKIKQVYNYMVIQHAFFSDEEENNKMLREVLDPDIPTMTELLNNIGMVLFNTHRIWEDNRPVPTNVVYMGGLPEKPHKELPEDLKSYLDNSKHGVIFVSFGTNVLPSMLPQEKVQMMVNAFSQLPYDILWKWDKDELPGRSKNIKIGKWFPQSDLLKHPKVRLFITQGGLQSTDEAILAGVPVIGIPMIFDQAYQTEKFVRHKIGQQVHIETMTEEQLKGTITEIVNDDSYRQNVVRLRTLMYDQPQRPLERAIWWIEYVIRHRGASHLRAPTANMTWAEYLELELVAVLLTCLLAIITVISLAVYYAWKYVTKHFITAVKLKNA